MVEFNETDWLLQTYNTEESCLYSTGGETHEDNCENEKGYVCMIGKSRHSHDVQWVYDFER